MTDDTNELSEEQKLCNAHKKERKELQAKIQVLKKTICKGDKKKKKEITEEILKLEADLDKKHDEEMACLKLSQISTENSKVDIKNEIDENGESVNLTNNQEECKSIGRVSKAQKRREKKENAEKERNQRIIVQEILNIHGKRNVEIEKIRDILIKRDLTIHEIPSDGHCLYNAIAHQLEGIDKSTAFNFKDLRKKTAIYLKEHADNFLPFIDNPDSDELLSPQQFDKYCNNVAETNAWGGAIEVLSHIFKCPIEVIQADGAPYIVGNEYDPVRNLILTYHRHMYQLGAHYNSVKSIIKSVDR